ncbi:zinc finger protein 830 isoform X2 [Cherax quadricarinatus]|uniref:zinc finger protein 830 isoform X2 n=1 Tax=Cherax quadricarinatus TaxID=27406 RepID=UPI00387E4072
MNYSRSKTQDIKQLMQEQQKTKAVTKQIDSPYAKYNSRGQLMCIVCGTVVKSVIIWQAHVNKRSHLENLAALKKKQQQLNNQQLSNNKNSTKPPGGQKRPASPLSQSSNKKAPTSSFKPKGVPEGFFDTDETISNSQEEESIYQEKPPKPKDPPKPNTTEVLPEGFFDDPVADAKARKVEYKDKDAEEWLSFMREVSAAEQQSRMIIEEDKEEAALATQIEQANEQIACLERVVELDKKKTTQLKERGNQKADSDDSEDSSDEEFAPVIWRTKNSLI